MHRVTIIDGRDDDRVYAGTDNRMVGPFNERGKAALAIDRAAAAVAISYAGLDVSVDEAIDESFGASDDDERVRLADQYYLAALNLLDGAENTIIERMLADDPELKTCDHWVCTTCDYEWTGTDSECWNCQCTAQAEEEEAAA